MPGPSIDRRTALPVFLVDQLGSEAKKPKFVSRKSLRKQQKQEKINKRVNHFQNIKNKNSARNIGNKEENVKAVKEKVVTKVSDVLKTRSKSSNNKPIFKLNNELMEEAKTDVVEDESEANNNENNSFKDETILRLEKKLGIDSTEGLRDGKLRKEFEDDGLAELHDLVCDIDSSAISSYSDADYALMATQPHMMKLLESEDYDGLEAAVSDWKKKHPSKKNKKAPKDKESIEPVLKKQKTALTDDHDIEIAMNFLSGNTPVEEAVVEELTPLTLESEDKEKKIEKYVPPSLRSKVQDSIIPEKYVPPSLRSRTLDSSVPVDADPRVSSLLKRKLHSLINKMTESNIDSISSEIKKLYSDHARLEINGLLSDFLLESCADDSGLVPALLLCSSALITYLHLIIGFEIGAYFLEKISKLLGGLLSSIEVLDGKVNEKVSVADSLRCQNLTILLSHFYNFKMIGSSFVYSLIKFLCKSMSSLNIEVLLLLLTHCGTQLRKDDPSTLKDIIVLVQNAVKPFHNSSNIAEPILENASQNSRDESSLFALAKKFLPTDMKLAPKSSTSLRVQFMLDTILDLKNNRTRNVDMNERLQGLHRWLNIVIGKHKLDSTNKQLQISWDDLMNIDAKGRWWLVGSAYQGENQNQKPKTDSVTNLNNKISDSLTKKAKELRMNTDIRKSIFFVIMSSDDYLDSFEKLMKLNLKGKQERDVVRVILECCGHEKLFNPYYSLLAEKLCHYEKSYRFSFQLALWDLWKQIESFTPRRVSNLSKFLARLIKNNYVSIVSLKTIEFQGLEEKMILFLHILFSELLLQDEFSSSDSSHLFSTLSRDENIEVRDGILYYLQAFFIPANAKDSSKIDGNLLKQRIKMIKKVMEPKIEM